MPGPNSAEWERVRDVEDCLGLLALIKDRLLAIRIQAWNEGCWDRVFEDAVKALEELRILQAGFGERWAELIEEARE